MTAEFYLFDVDHGQSSALRFPNGRWCIFDLGCTSSFSPIRWIANRGNSTQMASPLLTLLGTPAFRFLKATVSHFHGDHIDDYSNLFQYGPDFLKTVDADNSYLTDCYATCAGDSATKVYSFMQNYSNGFSSTNSIPDYGAVAIRELCLPVDVARSVGGDANARVNNASVITRIDVYGNSILLCGDMQKEAWEAIIADQGHYGPVWRPFISNIDILVAPHHGHRNAYSANLLNLATPAVVLASVVSKDPNVESRYSQAPVKGISLNGDDYSCITTRQKGHIKVIISPPPSLLGGNGNRSWSFGNAALS